MTEKEADCYRKTKKHIEAVQRYIRVVIQELDRRSGHHDATKLLEPELSVFAEVTPKLADLTYGSDEYHKQLKELQEALDHHYAHNSHHPEHYEEGIDGMDLFDVVEMFCDWKAAVERHDDGDIFASIKHNKDRFDMSPQLVEIFRNTARRW